MPEYRHFKVKKKRASKYGRCMVRLLVGRDKERHDVHEDLLCSSSAYFRALLQGNRKDINGDCPICYDTMEFGQEEITYCGSCGSNIHCACIQEFERSQEADELPLACPLCRTLWSYPRSSLPTDGARATHKYCPELDAKAFEIYAIWLYEGRIQVEEEDNEIQMFDLVKACLMGSKLKDEKFRGAIIDAVKEVYEEKREVAEIAAVRLLYDSVKEFCNLKRVIVEGYSTGTADWFSPFANETDCPKEFLKDVIELFMNKRDQAPNAQEDNRGDNEQTNS